MTLEKLARFNLNHFSLLLKKFINNKILVKPQPLYPGPGINQRNSEKQFLIRRGSREPFDLCASTLALDSPASAEARKLDKLLAQYLKDMPFLEIT